MRRVPFALLVAAAGTALARPEPARTTWGDWVGDWQGSLAWTDCISAGAGSATLPIDAAAGVLAIDLRGAEAAFGELVLDETDAGATGRRGDLAVTLAPQPGGAAELTIALDSGCRAHGTVHRASTGIVACDRLVGWARIEGRCTTLARPPLENEARLARQRLTWASARGEARSAIAAQCEARASKVTAELVEAGCAPDPDPTAGVHGGECVAFVRSAARLNGCTNASSDLRAAMVRWSLSLAEQERAADPAARPALETRCRELRAQIADHARAVGCVP